MSELRATYDVVADEYVKHIYHDQGLDVSGVERAGRRARITASVAP